MTQQGILERSLGLRVMLVAALLLVTAGAIFVATRSAEAIGTHITVVDADYDGGVTYATGPTDAHDPTDADPSDVDYRLLGRLSVETANAVSTGPGMHGPPQGPQGSD